MRAHSYQACDTDALDFIAQLDRLSTPDTVMDAMARVLGRFGFQYFCFNTFPQPHEKFDDVLVASRVPAEWFELYLKEQYVHVDPSIRHCRRTVHPFEWSHAPYDPEREPRANEVVQRATDFGLSHGFLVPIPSPTGCKGNVWLGGDKLEMPARFWPIIQLVAMYAFDHLYGLRTPLPRASPLSAREREVLSWVANGKTAWEIGKILHITKRTVDEHAKTAFRKLGAVNRAQAVAIALRQRDIQI